MPEPRAGSAPIAPEPTHPVEDARPSLLQIGSLVLRSALLPGSGHLATGHRRSGRLILGLTVLLLLGLLAALVLAYVSPATVASWSVRPNLLADLRWAALLIAAAWIAVIIWAAVLARPGSRGLPGRLVAGAATLALAAAVAVPAALVSHYADVQRTFVQDVFHDTPVTGGTAQGAPDRPLSNGRLNVLLVGSDAGPDRTGARTDTVILASLNTRTGRTVLFTLPRNLQRVPFAPGSVMAKQFPRGFSCGDECLLNAVYSWAVEHPALFPGDPDPGMTALISAVTATLGLPVDYHAVVDLAGFQKMVDALGGVTIRVERRLPIGGLDADSHHVRPSGYIQPGLQHMNGETALAYARSRSDSSDYERIQRQRCLLGAIQRQADPGTLLANFQKVATTTADALQTDIPRNLLPDLVKLAFKIKSSPIEGLAFTPPLIEPSHPDFAAIRADVQAALVPASSTPSGPIPSSPTPSSPTSPGPSTTASPSPSTSATPVSVADVCSYQ